MRPIFVTSGEPSGVGPDICLDIALHEFDPRCPIVIIGDIEVLRQRAKILNRHVNFEQANLSALNTRIATNHLRVLHVACPSTVQPGIPNPDNAQYVVDTLDMATQLCLEQCGNAIVTAPVNKKIINDGGIKFTGHTEYFADKFNVAKVVMMLINPFMKVALLTVHLPLKDVPAIVTADNLNSTIQVTIDYFKRYYAIDNPKIAVTGLNPHAGEGGYLGSEEINIINPVIENWRTNGYAVSGSYPADTIFLHAHEYDVILAMYHDQGLPVLKYSGFESAINVTMGLPILRTSVDHGTALDIAGSGKANGESLINAIKFAIDKE